MALAHAAHAADTSRASRRATARPLRQRCWPQRLASFEARSATRSCPTLAEHRLTDNAVGQSKNIVSSVPQNFNGCSNAPIIRNYAPAAGACCSIGRLRHLRLCERCKSDQVHDFSRHRSLDIASICGQMRCVLAGPHRVPWAIVARDTAIFAGIIEMRISQLIWLHPLQDHLARLATEASRRSFRGPSGGPQYSVFGPRAIRTMRSAVPENRASCLVDLQLGGAAEY
jgi:hypothetical protein